MEFVCLLNDVALRLFRQQKFDEAEKALDKALKHVRQASATSVLPASVPSVRPLCVGTLATPVKDEEQLEYFNRGFVLTDEVWEWSHPEVLEVLFYLTFNRGLVSHYRGLQSASNESDLRKAYEYYRISLAFLEESHEQYELPVHNAMLLVGYMAACENVAHLHHHFCNRTEALYFHSYFLKAFALHSRMAEMGPREAEFFAFRAHMATQPSLTRLHAGAA